MNPLKMLISALFLSLMTLACGSSKPGNRCVLSDGVKESYYQITLRNTSPASTVRVEGVVNRGTERARDFKSDRLLKTFPESVGICANSIDITVTLHNVPKDEDGNVLAGRLPLDFSVMKDDQELAGPFRLSFEGDSVLLNQ
jgi:hypothetical protein